MGEWTAVISAFFLPILLLVLQDVTSTQGQLRLVNGGSNYGRLEILYNGEWGTICDDNFGVVDARVACRELGLDTISVNFYSDARYGQGTGQIWLDEVACSGSESSIDSCSHSTYGSHDCSHSEDVGIICGSLTDGTMIDDIRLVDGGSDYGRLEVLLNRAWGTVCDDGFDILAAKVACRQLGLETSSVDYYPNARFGQGTGSIWLDEVDCFGTESTLDRCNQNSYGDNDCSHSEDVGISCGTTNVGGGSSAFSSVGSWIGGVVFIIILCVVTVMFRRRRLRAMRQQQTTTCIRPPTTTTVHVTTTTNAPGTTPMPTYHHTPTPQQQPSGQQPYPTQTFTPAYPSTLNGGAPPANPYPVQAYPPPIQSPAQPPAGTTPYPPQQTGAAPYPPQSTPGAGPYPPQSTPGAAPYPPQQPGDAPPLYPPQSNNVPEADLPPPPSYDDVTKQ